MRNLSIGVVIGVVLSLAVVATAHENEPRQRVIVTLSPDGTMNTPQSQVKVEALVLMDLPRSPRAARLIGLYDLDRSGDFNALEAQLVVGALGLEAVGGLVLRVDGEPLKAIGADATASLNRSRDGLVVALMLTFTVKARHEGPSKLTLHVANADDRGPRRAAAMVVEIQVTPPLSLITSSAQLAEDAPVAGPVPVIPGGSPVWVEFLPLVQKRER